MPPAPPHLQVTRLKTALKMAISKSKFIQEKKTALTKQQRRQLADLLKQGKETSAKIRVENIIRDDIYIELLEYLELYCELLLARISIILDPSRTSCDTNIAEAVQSVIYAASHSELKEMVSIRDILVYKYGPELGKTALDNSAGVVPEKIVKRCQVEPPEETLVDLYLQEIARAYEAPYSGLKEVTPEPPSDDDSPSGGVKEPEKTPTPAVALADPSATPASATDGATPANSRKVVTKEQTDFDALKARFAALKGK